MLPCRSCVQPDVVAAGRARETMMHLHPYSLVLPSIVFESLPRYPGEYEMLELTIS
jgi:hypothetical protein